MSSGLEGAIKDSYSCHVEYGYGLCNANGEGVLGYTSSYSFAIPSRMKWWKLIENEAVIVSRVRLPTITTVDETSWKSMKAKHRAAMSVLGNTRE